MQPQPVTDWTDVVKIDYQGIGSMELGFVGLTMGASMCVIFAGAVFLKLSNKETSDLEYNPCHGV